MIELWLDRYRVEAELGGAHYAVYLAFDTQTHARVVLKVLRPECVGSDTSFRAWWSDTRIRAHLRCPALPRVYAYGFAPMPWSVSEWIEGYPLQVLLNAGDNAMRAGLLAVMDGVETLAAAGVLATDSHPSNWLLAQSRAVYVDCGDVVLSTDAASLRRDLGDLFYFMAVGRDAVGHWSETFRSLGATVAPPPEVHTLRPELKTSGPLISQVRAGTALGAAKGFTWAEVESISPQFGQAIVAESAEPYLRGAVDHIRLSPVARIDTDGFIHVSRYKGLQQWLDAHAMTGEPLIVTCENAAHADAATRAVCDDLRQRVGTQPLLFVET